VRVLCVTIQGIREHDAPNNANGDGRESNTKSEHAGHDGEHESKWLVERRQRNRVDEAFSG
jgi:hypothetical protein